MRASFPGKRYKLALEGTASESILGERIARIDVEFRRRLGVAEDTGQATEPVLASANTGAGEAPELPVDGRSANTWPRSFVERAPDLASDVIGGVRSIPRC